NIEEMDVQISLLGSLQASVDGRAIDLGSPQQRAILALLAIRAGSVVPAETLVDELWPEAPPPTAGKVVQTYISRLRKSLGEETIERRPSGYVLTIAPFDVDAIRFERLLRDGRARDALDLWSGAVLEDFRDVPVLRDEAQRLEELRLQA